MGLREAVIRLASQRPEFRETLVPLVFNHDARAKWARGGGRWDAVWIGKDVRVSYHNAYILVEEIPGKKFKRQMGYTEITMWYAVQTLHLDEFLGINLINDAKLSKSMDYDKVLKALKGAVDKARKAVEKKGLDKDDGVRVSEKQVFYLKVVPLDVQPITAEAKDFAVTSEWTEFSAYSPSSDFQLQDPYYTKIKEKSSGAARKLFKILKADPKALKGVSWEGFTDWLSKEKIGYDYQHSVW